MRLRQMTQQVSPPRARLLPPHLQHFPHITNLLFHEISHGKSEGEKTRGRSKCAGDTEAKMRKGSKKKYGQVLFCLSLRPYLQEEGFKTDGNKDLPEVGLGVWVTGTRVVCDSSRRIQPDLPS